MSRDLLVSPGARAGADLISVVDGVVGCLGSYEAGKIQLFFDFCSKAL